MPKARWTEAQHALTPYFLVVEFNPQARTEFISRRRPNSLVFMTNLSSNLIYQEYSFSTIFLSFRCVRSSLNKCLMHV